MHASCVKGLRISRKLQQAWYSTIPSSLDGAALSSSEVICVVGWGRREEDGGGERGERGGGGEGGRGVRSGFQHRC